MTTTSTGTSADVAHAHAGERTRRDPQASVNSKAILIRYIQFQCATFVTLLNSNIRPVPIVSPLLSAR